MLVKSILSCWDVFPSNPRTSKIRKSMSKTECSPSINAKTRANTIIDLLNMNTHNNSDMTVSTNTIHNH